VKKILVYGIGVSGLGAAEALMEIGKQIILYNDTPKDVTPDFYERLRASGGELVIGNGEKLLPQVEQIILSPSVTPENKIVAAAKEHGIECIAEVELASRLFKGSFAAVTGTNGKTTTTTLVGEFFKTLPEPSAIGGNIGVALSLATKGLNAKSWVAAELSSFQLEGIVRFKPKVAAILNLTPDHLEYHHSMENYARAKQRIFLNQDDSDYTVLNYDDIAVRSWAQKTRGQVCYFSRKRQLEQGIYMENGNFVIRWGGDKITVCRKDELQIFGGHNEENVLAALACAYFAGVTPENMRGVLKTFKGLEHRLEYVETVDGVKYFNDTKATNTDSTIKALDAFEHNRVILLAGGYDKGTELTALMQKVKEKTDALILFGAARIRFAAAAEAAGVKSVIMVKNMDEALHEAHTLAVPPQVVLLSPACSSFDQFPNFVVRGRVFKELVHKLSTTPAKEE